MLTEVEAKKKTCCQPLQIAYIGGEEGTGVNYAGNCIASNCMAWRWSDNAKLWFSKGEMALREESYPENSFVLECEGYCGLAGKEE